jgi:uncharacterized repeat protein (TIGR02543 family)
MKRTILAAAAILLLALPLTAKSKTAKDIPAVIKSGDTITIGGYKLTAEEVSVQGSRTTITKGQVHTIKGFNTKTIPIENVVIEDGKVVSTRELTADEILKYDYTPFTYTYTFDGWHADLSFVFLDDKGLHFFCDVVSDNMYEAYKKYTKMTEEEQDDYDPYDEVDNFFFFLFSDFCIDSSGAVTSGTCISSLGPQTEFSQEIEDSFDTDMSKVNNFSIITPGGYMKNLGKNKYVFYCETPSITGAEITSGTVPIGPLTVDGKIAHLKLEDSTTPADISLTNATVKDALLSFKNQKFYVNGSVEFDLLEGCTFPLKDFKTCLPEDGLLTYEDKDATFTYKTNGWTVKGRGISFDPKKYTPIVAENTLLLHGMEISLGKITFTDSGTIEVKQYDAEVKGTVKLAGQDATMQCCGFTKYNDEILFNIAIPLPGEKNGHCVYFYDCPLSPDGSFHNLTNRESICSYGAFTIYSHAHYISSEDTIEFSDASVSIPYPSVDPIEINSIAFDKNGIKEIYRPWSFKIAGRAVILNNDFIVDQQARTITVGGMMYSGKALNENTIGIKKIVIGIDDGIIREFNAEMDSCSSYIDTDSWNIIMSKGLGKIEGKKLFLDFSDCVLYSSAFNSLFPSGVELNDIRYDFDADKFLYSTISLKEPIEISDAGITYTIDRLSVSEDNMMSLDGTGTFTGSTASPELKGRKVDIASFVIAPDKTVKETTLVMHDYGGGKMPAPYSDHDRTVTPISLDGGSLTLAVTKRQYIVRWDTNIAPAATAKSNQVTSLPEPVTTLRLGDAIAKPQESPKRKGYRFSGWYKDALCTKPWYFEKDIVSDDTVLYAKWTVLQPGLDGIWMCAAADGLNSFISFNGKKNSGVMFDVMNNRLVPVAISGKNIIINGKDTFPYTNEDGELTFNGITFSRSSESVLCCTAGEGDFLCGAGRLRIGKDGRAVLQDVNDHSLVVECTVMRNIPQNEQEANKTYLIDSDGFCFCTFLLLGNYYDYYERW